MQLGEKGKGRRVGIEKGKIRSHGQTTADSVAEEQSEEIDKPVDAPEEPVLNLTRAFQRMRTDWQGPDRDTIEAVKDLATDRIFDNFVSAYSIQFDIWDVVRKPAVNEETGEVLTDDNGLAIWARNDDGSFIEDWSKIKSWHREQFLYRIITNMFDWEQKAADAWGEALFAKAQWEEAFASGFDTITEKATVDARTARANRLAADHRYLAVYKSFYSKKAEALVRSMDRLAQRLKDLHVS